VTRICIVSSHRSERGLLQPLIDRLEAHPHFEADTHSLCSVCTFNVSYNNASNHFASHEPDVVLIPCDRLEAFAGALAAFELEIPIIHFHAGDTGTQSNDEVYRAMISMMASVHLCNGPTAKNVVIDLLTAVKRSTEHVYDVGSTMLDEIEINTSLCPDEPYDLVMYHPPANDPELINMELDEIEKLLDPDVVTIWFAPNGDLGSDIIIRRITQSDALFYIDIPRPQFLGRVSRCRRFIGNSSSMVCEAPMWLREEQIIHVGNRNRNRSHDEIRPGGTDRIIEILEGIDWSGDLKTGSHQR